MEEGGGKADGLNWPAVSDEQRALYELLFYSQGPLDGYLLGENVRDLFLKSGLSLRVLSQIWNLADVSKDNVLNVHEFVLAMHVTRGLLKGLQLPETLPRKLTPPSTEPVLLPPVTPQEKEGYTRMFQALDSNGQGSISSETVRTVFEATRQPPEVLARVWDLADVSRDGRLDEQEFCLACHLLRLATTGRNLAGPVDVFVLLPDRVAPQSLQSRKRRVQKYEENKQKLMSLKEKRKKQVLQENQRLQLQQEKLQLLTELFTLQKKSGKLSVEEEVFKTYLTQEKKEIENQEEIVFRLKKEHERVRQDTVKIILAEQKLSSDIAAIKKDTDELNRRLSACLTQATKDPDPFHQLFEQRKEKRQGSTIKDLDKIELFLPFSFNPFDVADSAQSLSQGKNLFLASSSGSDNHQQWSSQIFNDLKGFGEELLLLWTSSSDRDKMDEEAEDLTFKEEPVSMADEQWLGLRWTEGEGRQKDGGAVGDVERLHEKLLALKTELQKLNQSGSRLVFRNPEDYCAGRIAREEEEKAERVRVQHRSVSDRRSGQSDILRNRHSYTSRNDGVSQAVREYRQKRQSAQNLESADTSSLPAPGDTTPHLEAPKRPPRSKKLSQHPNNPEKEHQSGNSVPLSSKNTKAPPPPPSAPSTSDIEIPKAPPRKTATAKSVHQVPFHSNGQGLTLGDNSTCDTDNLSVAEKVRHLDGTITAVSRTLSKAVSTTDCDIIASKGDAVTPTEVAEVRTQLQCDRMPPGIVRGEILSEQETPPKSDAKQGETQAAVRNSVTQSESLPVAMSAEAAGVGVRGGDGGQSVHETLLDLDPNCHSDPSSAYDSDADSMPPPLPVSPPPPLAAANPAPPTTCDGNMVLEESERQQRSPPAPTTTDIMDQQVMCVTQMQTGVFTLDASRVDGRGQPQPTDISGQTCFDGSLDVDTRSSHMYTVTNNTENTVLHAGSGVQLMTGVLPSPDYSEVRGRAVSSSSSQDKGDDSSVVMKLDCSAGRDSALGDSLSSTQGERPGSLQLRPSSSGSSTDRTSPLSPPLSPVSPHDLSPRGRDIVEKARHFADMVHKPRVAAKRDHSQEELDQDTLHDLELQRRAAISQSTVRRRDAQNLLSPKSTDSIEPSAPAQLNSQEPPSPEYPNSPAAKWTTASGKVVVYSENIIQEPESTEAVDRESIANLATTRRQWENIFSIEPHDQSVARVKKHPPKWEVRLPYTEKVHGSCDTLIHIQSPADSTSIMEDATSAESAIEKEIRLALEREETMRREHEELVRQLAKRQQTAATSSSMESSSDSDLHASFNEMTEADRGSRVWIRGNAAQHEDAEQEEAMQRASIPFYSQKHNSTVKDAENSTESIIEREIRLQREREVELAKQRGLSSVHVEVVPVSAIECKPHTSTEKDETDGRAADISADGEGVIARELRELREREEEIRRLRENMVRLEVTASSAPSVYKSSTQSASAISLPADKHQQTIASAKQHPTNTDSRHLTSEAVPSEPLQSPPQQNPHPNQETPIEREIRLARERENELRRAKGLPELKPEQRRLPSIDDSDRHRNFSHNHSVPEPDNSIKRFASNRLQQEILTQRSREMELKGEGKIITTSEEHIQPLRYSEVTGQDRVDGTVKRNFKTPGQKANAHSTDSVPNEANANAVPSHSGKLAVGKKTHLSGGASFSYHEFKQTAESKIERELREMREREEELRQQRTATFTSPS